MASRHADSTPNTSREIRDIYRVGALGLSFERPGGELTSPYPMLLDGGKVILVTPDMPPPLAYYDGQAEGLFVDPDHQLVVAEHLHATIGEDGTWMVPMGGGEKALKAEDLREWDPTKAPTSSSFRIRNNDCVMVNHQFQCLLSPKSDPKIWLDSKVFTYGQCVGPKVRPCREEFDFIGPLKI